MVDVSLDSYHQFDVRGELNFLTRCFLKICYLTVFFLSNARH